MPSLVRLRPALPSVPVKAALATVVVAPLPMTRVEVPLLMIEPAPLRAPIVVKPPPAPFRSKVAPWRRLKTVAATWEVPIRPEAPDSCTVPWLILTLPVKALAPLRTRVPLPALVSEPVLLLIAEAIVNVLVESPVPLVVTMTSLVAAPSWVPPEISALKGVPTVPPELSKRIPPALTVKVPFRPTVVVPEVPTILREFRLWLAPLKFRVPVVRT